MSKVIGLGECVVDFIPQGISEHGHMMYQACPGGSVANVCVGVSKLGLSSAFVGAVGNDYFGEDLRHTLQGYGVDVKNMVATDESGTFLAFVHLAEGNERHYSFVNLPGADKMLRIEDLDLSVLQDAQVLHVSSNAAAGAITRQTQQAAMQKARQLGVAISYDVNYRPNNHANEAQALDVMREPLQYATVVKATEEELELLTQKKGPEGAKLLLAQGPKIVVVTEGKHGASYYMQEASGHGDAPEVRVEDTTGAGDAFLSGFLASMLESGGFAACTPAQVQNALEYANKVATLSVMKWGAMAGLPTKQEVEQAQF